MRTVPYRIVSDNKNEPRKPALLAPKDFKSYPSPKTPFQVLKTPETRINTIGLVLKDLDRTWVGLDFKNSGDYDWTHVSRRTSSPSLFSAVVGLHPYIVKYRVSLRVG